MYVLSLCYRMDWVSKSPYRSLLSGALKAASEGHTASQERVAISYQSGLGTSQDLAGGRTMGTG